MTQICFRHAKVALLLGVTLVSGCSSGGAIGIGGTAMPAYIGDDSDEAALAWFRQVNTAWDRQTSLEHSFATWGTGDAQFDRRIATVLLHCYGESHQGGVGTDELARNIIIDRIRQKPDLVRQVWLAYRSRGPNAEQLVPLPDFAQQVFSTARTDDEKFFYLLLTSSMTNRADLVTSIRPHGIDDGWNRLKIWLENNADRFKYNPVGETFELR